MSKTISTSRAARIAGCSQDTVLRWIEEGAIEAHRSSPRGWHMIEYGSLTRFLKRHGFVEHEPVVREAMEKERDRAALGDGLSKEMRVSEAARIADCSP